jgi:hypothetical protein
VCCRDAMIARFFESIRTPRRCLQINRHQSIRDNAFICRHSDRGGSSAFEGPQRNTSTPPVTAVSVIRRWVGFRPAGPFDPRRRTSNEPRNRSVLRGRVTDRMSAGVKMLPCAPPGRLIAAADVTAVPAYPQMYPMGPALETLLAASRAGFYLHYCAKVRTVSTHDHLL